MDLSATIHLLGEALGDVLRTQESADLFETEERIRSLAKARRSSPGRPPEHLAAEVAALSVDAARATASAFAVYFDLVNLAEEAQRIRALRERERSAHPAPIGESIGAAIGEIKSRGVTPERMAALLGALRIELVLTAHPTEAKRRTVLSKLQRIGEMLRSLHDPDLLPRERDARDRRAAGGDHRALAHRALAHRPPRRHRRGAHRALLRRRGLLGRAAEDLASSSTPRWPSTTRAWRRPGRLAHAGLVDRRRPRRQPVGGDAA